MIQNTQEQDLKDSLAKLETALLTPVISGELESWIQAARQASTELGEHLRRYTEVVLRKEYKEIAKSDQELLFRVEQMAADDAALKTEYEQLQNELNNLALRVPKGERDEGKSADHQARVEKLGTALILHIKRHQVAVSTWLSEAVYRDRGPVD